MIIIYIDLSVYDRFSDPIRILHKVSLQVPRSWAIRFSISYPVAPHSVIKSSRKPLRGLPVIFFPCIQPSMTLIKPSSCRIMCPSHFFCLSLFMITISYFKSFPDWNLFYLFVDCVDKQVSIWLLLKLPKSRDLCVCVKVSQLIWWKCNSLHWIQKYISV